MNRMMAAMRVLFIEDEPDLAGALARALRREGYAVDLASTGDDGLFKALSTDYRLIVLDVMLPGLNGWQVLERLRERGRDTPVLMLTARDTTPDRVRGLDMGADDYLVKPCDTEELLARVRALIRRSAGKANPILEIREVQIDLPARTVQRAGRFVELTALEFSMLAYFALHRGEILTRTRLYEHLFDEREDSTSNVIDVHIFHLRKKLGRDFILTRRGMGYVLP